MAQATSKEALALIQRLFEKESDEEKEFHRKSGSPSTDVLRLMKWTIGITCGPSWWSTGKTGLQGTPDKETEIEENQWMNADFCLFCRDCLSWNPVDAPLRDKNSSRKSDFQATREKNQPQNSVGAARGDRRPSWISGDPIQGGIRPSRKSNLAIVRGKSEP